MTCRWYQQSENQLELRQIIINASYFTVHSTICSTAYPGWRKQIIQTLPRDPFPKGIAGGIWQSVNNAGIVSITRCNHVSVNLVKAHLRIMYSFCECQCDAHVRRHPENKTRYKYTYCHKHMTNKRQWLGVVASDIDRHFDICRTIYETS